MTAKEQPIGPLFKERNFQALMAMKRAEPSRFDSTTLRLMFDSAGRAIDFPAMQFVLDIGYDINEVSPTGTPLSRVASKGSVTAIQWLLEHGARIDESNVSVSPLCSAIQNGHLEAVKLFIALGVDPARRYPCGRNALAFARIWNNPDIVAELGGAPDWKRPPRVTCCIPNLTGHKPSIQMLRYVEQELGLALPSPLTRFLLQELPETLFFPDAKDDDDWIWLGKDFQLFHTSRSLIAYNCKHAEQPQKQIKYKNHIVIGTDGSGNEWCIRRSCEEGQVWYRDHETEEFFLEYESIGQFAEALEGELRSGR